MYCPVYTYDNVSGPRIFSPLGFRSPDDLGELGSLAARNLEVVREAVDQVGAGIRVVAHRPAHSVQVARKPKAAVSTWPGRKSKSTYYVDKYSRTIASP